MTETNEHLRCFSVNDAASRLCVHRDTLYRMVREGKLRAVHIGRKVCIPAEALEEFLAPAPQKPVSDGAQKRRIITQIV